jgi:hypothetical protein
VLCRTLSFWSEPPNKPNIQKLPVYPYSFGTHAQLSQSAFSGDGPVEVGALVKVREDIPEPRYGWASISHDSVGL